MTCHGISIAVAMGMNATLTKGGIMVFTGSYIGDCAQCGMEARLTDGYCFDCLSHREAGSNVATWEEINKLELRVRELESIFRHHHVSNEVDDACKACSLDLRDPVHIRITRP